MTYRAIFRIFLTGCRLFASIEILVVTDLISNTKNYFF